MVWNKQKLPQYSKRDEIINSSTHFAGFIFGVIALVLLIVRQVKYQIGMSIMYSYYIYIFFMLFMFFASAFYHSRKFDSKPRAIARIIDHADIHAFVAATYTPICLLGIPNPTYSYTILVMEWAMALIGMIFIIFGLHKSWARTISYIIYILSGWLVVFFYIFVDVGLPFLSFLFILLGGIAYTIGAVIYAVGRNKYIWLHSVFHIFVLLAAILQFVGVWFLI